MNHLSHSNVLPVNRFDRPKLWHQDLIERDIIDGVIISNHFRSFA